MNNTSRVIAITAALATLMAVSRFNHFGSAVSLPDASLAIFFLGGLHTARFARASVAVFLLLILEAGLVDYYATSAQHVSAYCITPAYWGLVVAYGGLWLAGRWFARHHAMTGRGLAVLAAVAWAASSFAFVFSNAVFYLYSGYFSGMSALEYTSRVSQYYGSYISVAMFYIACAVGITMAWTALIRPGAHSHPA